MMIICKSYNPETRMMDYAQNITMATAIRNCIYDTALAAIREGLTSAATNSTIDRFMMNHLGEYAEKNLCPDFVYGEKDISLMRDWIAFYEKH